MAWHPKTPPSQPHWKIATTPPKAANSDRTNPPVAISGTNSDRNTTHHDEQREPDDEGEVEREGVRQLLRDVDVAAGLAGDAERDAAVERRQRAQVRDELLGRHARRPVAGTTWKASVRPSADVPIGATATTSSTLATAVADAHLLREHLVPVAPAGKVGDDEQRTVDTGAELLGDEVVGLVLGRVRRPRRSRRAGRAASTARARPAPRGRRRQHDDGDDRPGSSTSARRACGRWRPATRAAARSRRAARARPIEARAGPG